MILTLQERIKDLFFVKRSESYFISIVYFGMLNEICFKQLHEVYLLCYTNVLFVRKRFRYRGESKNKIIFDMYT